MHYHVLLISCYGTIHYYCYHVTLRPSQNDQLCNANTSAVRLQYTSSFKEENLL